IDDSPSYIFETIFSLYDKDNIIHKNFEVVRTIYRDCCLYVHSASLTEDNLCSCLIEYDKFYNKDESTLFLKQFDKAYRIINNLILIYNKKIFDEMKYNSQLIIREYTNQEDLKSIFEYWNNIK
ncbi:hypothetical protein, partial [Clostridium luticellarii]|uniref:hypothetical protein n=1 Tax=Clostridium luticellarii TaxID=1691940 RepID=UPI001304FFCD